MTKSVLEAGESFFFNVSVLMKAILVVIMIELDHSSGLEDGHSSGVGTLPLVIILETSIKLLMRIFDVSHIYLWIIRYCRP